MGSLSVAPAASLFRRNRIPALREHPPGIMALLTHADKKNIQHIWAKLFENPEENGKTVVIKLFKDYPETKAYFKTIPTEGNLQEDPLVRFHGRRVMVALNQVVENLDNWKQACRILDRLADKHKNVHQVPAMNFQSIFQVILSVCKDLLGNEFSIDVSLSWEKLFGLLSEQINASYVSTSKS
ncbi:hemoglobin subunit alpha-D-like isoform X2 [Mauremys mutica]|uniref:hemoglobin subunit alpha-D-like isoform X2 n=1 Tax=Mauremys mutica TaxID=74926 RepID=UPI001D14E199|nr:hemoglobin subunit alpha-D-like isoform X2 [Mauremys mutica]